MVKTSKKKSKPKVQPGKHLGWKRFIPKYFRDSYQELKVVTWPSRRESWRLLIAVIIFSVILVIIVSLADYLFGWIIEKVIL